MNELEKRANHHRKFQKGCLFPFSNAESASLIESTEKLVGGESDEGKIVRFKKTSEKYQPGKFKIEKAFVKVYRGFTDVKYTLLCHPHDPMGTRYHLVELDDIEVVSDDGSNKSLSEARKSTRLLSEAVEKGVKVYDVEKDGPPEVGRQIIAFVDSHEEYTILTRQDKDYVNKQHWDDKEGHKSSDGEYYSGVNGWIYALGYSKYIYLDELDLIPQKHFDKVAKEQQAATEKKAQLVRNLVSVYGEKLGNELAKQISVTKGGRRVELIGYNTYLLEVAKHASALKGLYESLIRHFDEDTVRKIIMMSPTVKAQYARDKYELPLPSGKTVKWNDYLSAGYLASEANGYLILKRISPREDLDSLKIQLKNKGILEGSMDIFSFARKYKVESLNATKEHSLLEYFEQDYSHIPEVKGLDFIGRPGPRMPGFDSRKFKAALDNVGLSYFKIRASRMNGVSLADLKDEFGGSGMYPWTFFRAWDSSVAGFNEFYFFKKATKDDLDERWSDDALDELFNKPKEEWTEADWDTYNYCKNANAERDYYDSLDESKKKKVKGVHLNKDAGNVEHNIAAFNHAMNAAEGPSTNPCGPMGESVGTKWVNFYYNGKKIGGYTAAEEFDGERADTLSLLAYDNNCDPDDIDVRIELNESRSVKDNRDIRNLDEAVNDPSDLTQYIEARLIDITNGFTASQTKGTIKVPEGVSTAEMHDAIYNILGKYYSIFCHRNYRVGRNMSVVIEGKPLEVPLEVAPAYQRKSSTTSRPCSTIKSKKKRVIPYKYYEDSVDGWVESEIIMTPSTDEAGGYDVSWGDNDDYEWCATVREAKALVARYYDKISFESNVIKEDFAKTKDYEYYKLTVPSPNSKGYCSFGVHEHNDGHCSISGIHPYDDGDYHWATSRDGVTFKLYVGNPGKLVKTIQSDGPGHENICRELAELDSSVKSVMVHW